MTKFSDGGDRDDRADKDQVLKKRLDHLGKRIKEARGEPEQSSGGGSERGSAMGAAFKLATEMVAGVAVGGGLGYYGDKAAGTTPFLLIVFLILGGAAGIMNAIRVARNMQNAVEKDKRDNSSS